MFTVLTDVDCYCPAYIGRKDILISGGKIAAIKSSGELTPLYGFARIIPCEGLFAFPGLVDQHIHLTGGGGETGPASRIGEINPDEILLSGVTTVVGTLGFDAYTKSLSSLLAKAKALETTGLTTYIYTGSYAVPPVTLTGSVAGDLQFVDKVIGTGEIAISDCRSSQPSFDQLVRLSAETHNAAQAAGKAGVMHMHIGDGKRGLSPLTDLLAHTDLPIEMFVPTHINRNPVLFSQGTKYCGDGGNIDLTAGETIGIPVPTAIRMLFDNGIDLSLVTVSSDANGSAGNSTTKIQNLYADIRDGILSEHIPPETMFRLATENVAKILKLYPAKGTLSEGSDADILITDNEFNMQILLCGGKVAVDRDQIVKE